MAAQSDKSSDIIGAMNGGHLHWIDFREDVLRPFRIRCSSSPRNDRLPTTFLARLEASQKNLARFDIQKRAWRLDVAAGRGLSALTVFPANLVPPLQGTSNILRCMMPRMSREDLPLRDPSLQDHTLYELPRAKPAYVCGFDVAVLEKIEQAQLSGGLSATGTIVDFNRGEVLPGVPICCPFLAFEKSETNAQKDIEVARNACAITGTQSLRSQQQLFHKAFGLQTVSQPPISFTCAISDEHAIIHCHYVDDDGEYTMASLCRFNLVVDDHFLMFLAWVQAIESWASLYLLPRFKGAISQIIRSNPSPPPSPTRTINSQLSIDTKSDSRLLTIMAELRRNWSTIHWQNDTVEETPINSSIAQCGTPLGARQMRGLSLPQPSSNEANEGLSFREGSPAPTRPHRSRSQCTSGALTPLQTNVSLYPRPRSSIHHRRFSIAGSTSSPASDGSEQPYSPCRPPTLSPCTPGPEAPVSAKSPMLIMQKRLDLAMDEIQGLRTQVDDLQAQLNGRTEVLERRLALIVERQEAEMSSDDGIRTKVMGVGWVKQLEAVAEDELRTPTAQNHMRNAEEDVSERLRSSTATPEAMQVPRQLPVSDERRPESQGALWLTEDFVVRCLAILLRHAKASRVVTTLVVLLLCFGGYLDTGGLCANLALVLVLEERVKGMPGQFWCRLNVLYDAAQTYNLQNTDTAMIQMSDVILKEQEEADVPIVLA